MSPSTGDAREPPGHKHHQRTPPWWPEGESWPPPGWERGAWRHSAWRHGGRRPWGPLGCLFAAFALFSVGTVVVGLWAAAALVGLVQAPTIVVVGGVVAFVVIALGALAAARAFRRMTQPLDELIDASRRIEAGDYSTRVSVAGSREMRSLGRAFNQMSAQLESVEARRRAFLAEVTHELRTPLTVIRGQLEAIEDGVYEPDAERITALLGHANQMTALVEDLHTLSLAEVGGLHLRPRSTDLAELIDEVAARYRPSADLAGVTLRIAIDEPVRAEVDVDATTRVLGNLVSNALRYTGRGGVITLQLSRRAEMALLRVIDNGAGMAAELAARAFERFEKGEQSTGSGLGLAIARDLVEAQRGSIELASVVGAGTTVTVTLPATPD